MPLDLIKNRIAVFMGGLSAERDVSLISGMAALKALKEAGFNAFAYDVSDDSLSDCPWGEFDIAFLALHGEFGEDGHVQEILEQHKVLYTGSGVKASALAMNKHKTKQALKSLNIKLAKDAQFKNTVKQDEILDTVDLPFVIKPNSGGSSIGTSIVHKKEKVSISIEKAKDFGQIIVEQFIDGRELTVGILDNKALPIIELQPTVEFYDYEAKYNRNDTKHILNPDLPNGLEQKIKEQALLIFKTLGLRDYARIDFILNKENEAYFLEANTLPGLTSVSLFPEAANSSGIPFAELCKKLVILTLKRQIPGSNL